MLGKCVVGACCPGYSALASPGSKPIEQWRRSIYCPFDLNSRGDAIRYEKEWDSLSKQGHKKTYKRKPFGNQGTSLNERISYHK